MLASLMVLGGALGAGDAYAETWEPTPILGDTCADARRFPDDYGAWAACARAAEAGGEAAAAVAAWTRANALAGGNLEASTGAARAALAGDHGLLAAARTATAEAVVLAPDSAYAWQLRAEALRRPLGDEAPARAWVLAHRAARRAVAVAPDDPFSRCELAWSRYRLGDVRGARVLFGDTDHPCAARGRAEATPTTGGWASVWGGLQRYPGSATATGSVLATAAAGVVVGSLVSADATARVGRLGLTDGVGAVDVPWRELWGSASLHHRGFGVEALVGGTATDWPSPPAPGGPAAPTDPSTDQSATARTLGARVWGGVWPTISASATSSAYPDGAAWQLALDGSAPVRAGLTLSAGVQVGAFTWARSSVRLLADPAAVDAAADGRALASGRVGAAWARDRWALSADLRAGPELRPVRWADRYAWPTSRRIGGSVAAQGGLQVGDPLWLKVRYDGLLLPSAAALGASSLDADAAGSSTLSPASIHALSVGLTTTFGGLSR